MSDFTLEPHERDPEPQTSRQRRFSSGLHPLEAVPKQQGPDPTPAYTPCEACGRLVLHGQTHEGLRLALDVGAQTYCVVWRNGAPRPTLVPSRAYPVHWCVEGTATT